MKFPDQALLCICKALKIKFKTKKNKPHIIFNIIKVYGQQ